MKHNIYTTLLLAGIMTTTLVASNGMCADSTISASTGANYVQLLDRIQKLEAEVQTLRTNAATSTEQKSTVRAEKIEILDKKGVVKLTISAASNGVVGLFVPSTDNPMITLSSEEDNGPKLTLRNAQGVICKLTASTFL
jgi:hypothetical protein